MITVEEIVERLRVIETELKSRYGSRVHFATAHIHPNDAAVFLFIYQPNGSIDKTFNGSNVEEALEKAEAWVARDEITDINLTLGLTATGKLE